jgi:DNA-binding winged helix-turn-helix (wHTH) protein
VAVNTSKGPVHFEGFELDLRAGELRKDGAKPVRLPEQPFLILTMLLEHAGEVVSREEVRKRLWPNDTIVEFEHSISAAMNRLRQALGASADNPRYIETLARRGYRLLVPVESVGRGTGFQPVEHGQDGQATADVPPAPGSADLSLRSAALGSPRTEEPQTLKDRSALPSAALASLTGKKVSHYRVLEVLGGGGMGGGVQGRGHQAGPGRGLEVPAGRVGERPEGLGTV